jgi:Holliday junction resolvase RusA-like endonuclease
MISFFVAGLPQTKGSTKGFVGRSKKTGKLRAFLTNDNVKNKGWAALVAWEARKVAPPKPYAGPVYLGLTFRLKKPKRPKHSFYHITKPDWDKLARSVGDALKEGGIYNDDAQVCEVSCQKIYASVQVGVQIVVRELT